MGVQHGVCCPGEMVDPVNHRRSELGASGKGLIQVHRIAVGREPGKRVLIVWIEDAACDRLVGHQGSWSCYCAGAGAGFISRSFGRSRSANAFLTQPTTAESIRP